MCTHWEFDPGHGSRPSAGDPIGPSNADRGRRAPDAQGGLRVHGRRRIWASRPRPRARAEPAQFRPGRLSGRPMLQIARARPASRTREDTARCPRDFHGAARGVRVKLEFSAPYWSLDQAKAWALTRHPELVSWAAKPANFKGAPVALAARIGLYLERARRQGQDVNAELWRTSGRPPPIESSSARNEPEGLREHGPDDSQGQEQPEGDESDLARLPFFPIEDHLVQLLRAGRIKFLGKRPSERRRQERLCPDWWCNSAGASRSRSALPIAP